MEYMPIEQVFCTLLLVKECPTFSLNSFVSPRPASVAWSICGLEILLLLIALHHKDRCAEGYFT